MRQYASLRRRSDFASVGRRGKRRSSQYLVCVNAAGRERTRVGLTVSAAIGNAVVRNRLRRRLLAILDGYQLGRRAPRDVIVIARPGAGELTFAQLAAEVGRTFEVPS